MKKFKHMLAAAALLQGAWAAGAHAEIVVIVNSKNPTTSLNATQVERLFLGKSSSFPDGAAALPIDQPKGAERDQFYLKATGKTASQLKAYWSKMVFTGAGQPPQEIESAQDVVDLVAKNPNVLGYIEKSAVNSSVRVVYSLP